MRFYRLKKVSYAKSSFLAVVLMSLAIASSGWAQVPSAGCYSQNSCWKFENALEERVLVKCADDRGYLSQKVWEVAPSSVFEIQFDNAWGDGLGFPEPGVLIQCQLERSSGQKLKSAMHSLDWGDLVRFVIGEGSVLVVQKSNWARETSAEQRLSWLK